MTTMCRHAGQLGALFAVLMSVPGISSAAGEYACVEGWEVGDGPYITFSGTPAPAAPFQWRGTDVIEVWRHHSLHTWLGWGSDELDRAISTWTLRFQEGLATNIPPMVFMGSTVDGGTPDWSYDIAPEDLPEGTIYLAPRDGSPPTCDGVATAYGHIDISTGAGRGKVLFTNAAACPRRSYGHGENGLGSAPFSNIMHHEVLHLFGSWHEDTSSGCDSYYICSDGVGSKGCTHMANGMTLGYGWTPTKIDQAFVFDGDYDMRWSWGSVTRDHNEKHQYSQAGYSWSSRTEHVYTVAPRSGLSSYDDGGGYMYMGARSGSGATFPQIHRWDQSANDWDTFATPEGTAAVTGAIDVDINDANGEPYMAYMFETVSGTNIKRPRIARCTATSCPLRKTHGIASNTTTDGISLAYDPGEGNFIAVWRNDELEIQVGAFDPSTETWLSDIVEIMVVSDAQRAIDEPTIACGDSGAYNCLIVWPTVPEDHANDKTYLAYAHVGWNWITGKYETSSRIIQTSIEPSGRVEVAYSPLNSLTYEFVISYTRNGEVGSSADPEKYFTARKDESTTATFTNIKTLSVQDTLQYSPAVGFTGVGDSDENFELITSYKGL